MQRAEAIRSGAHTAIDTIQYLREFSELTDPSTLGAIFQDNDQLEDASVGPLLRNRWDCKSVVKEIAISVLVDAPSCTVVV